MNEPLTAGPTSAGATGAAVEELCRSAASHLLLVAPFIKSEALRRLLSGLDPAVKVVCVTRWWPQEIAWGVSDLEVWYHFREQPNRRLYLRHDLHAKLFRADERCLVGSVNVTGRALGFVQPSNLELLVDVSAATPTVREFETELWRATVEVDDGVFSAMKDLVDSLPPRTEGEPTPAAPHESAQSHIGPDLAHWVPTTRHPEDLEVAYRGDGHLLSTTSAATAADDLAILRVPAGLDEASFIQAVGTLLLQTPVTAAIDRYIADRERRFGEVRDRLAALTQSHQGSHEWQTLLRWLTYYLPTRFSYRRPRHSELISRRVVDD